MKGMNQGLLRDYRPTTDAELLEGVREALAERGLQIVIAHEVVTHPAEDDGACKFIRAAEYTERVRIEPLA